MNKRHIFSLMCMTMAAQPLSADFVKQIPTASQAVTSEAYESLTADGAWCWFADPRAIYHKGINEHTYTSWIDSQGSVLVACYDHKTKSQKTVVIREFFQRDDHAQPALMMDKDGHLNVFYCGHNDERGIVLLRSLKPESIDAWEKPILINPNDGDIASKQFKTSYTYAHPFQMKDIDDNIYLYWRGMNYKPTTSMSKDGGKTWSTGRILFSPRGIQNSGRPYTKMYSNGDKQIHLVATDGHPRDEAKNSIYYFAFDKDGYKKADGTRINMRPEEGIEGKMTDLVYDGGAGKGRAWCWDVAEDENGYPVIAFIRFPDNNHHIYCYAAWDGEKWNVEDLIDAGKWFPQTPNGKHEPEPNYSAGLTIDKENPDTLYMSVKREGSKHFEIEKWQKTAEGWKVEAITKNSPKDNVRPTAVVGAEEGTPMQVMWMQNTYYINYFGNDYRASIKTDVKQKPVYNVLDKAQVIDKLCDVADWQLANLDPSDRREWIWGSFYIGLAELYKMTKDTKYLQELKNVGKQFQWKLLPNVFFGDYMAIADPWISVAEATGDKSILKDVDARMQAHLDRGFEGYVTHHAPPYPWWTWCDALYMAPPAFARAANYLNKPQYMDYLDQAWRKTKENLYDETESLYFRDASFKKQRSATGKKIFWGRGNGWVIGGLVRVLDQMPKNHPSRAFYEEHFKEMMARLLELQRADGLWVGSLLDYDDTTVSETSGSVFYIYGLIWGINNGLIDAKYTDRALLGWKTLMNRIDERGCLGFVQKAAAAPGGFTADDWQLYASGGIMLAGKELIKMMEKK